MAKKRSRETARILARWVEAIPTFGELLRTSSRPERLSLIVEGIRELILAFGAASGSDLAPVAKQALDELPSSELVVIPTEILRSFLKQIGEIFALHLEARKAGDEVRDMLKQSLKNLLKRHQEVSADLDRRTPKQRNGERDGELVRLVDEEKLSVGEAAFRLFDLNPAWGKGGEPLEYKAAWAAYVREKKRRAALLN